MKLVALQFFGIIMFGCSVLSAEVLYLDSKYLNKKEKEVMRYAALIFSLIGLVFLYFVIQEYVSSSKSNLASGVITVFGVYALFIAHKWQRYTPSLVGAVLMFLAGTLSY
jgi:uncharacterized membrane protein